MKIELIKRPTDEDWLLCKQCAFETIGKNTNTLPTADWKHRILAARHSPIRVLHFTFRLTDIPYWVSVHLCRHVHATPFVRSQRNDRQNDYDRNEAPQNVPVNMLWHMNAEELMVIANKRLCGKASRETREVVRKMCKLVMEAMPEFNGLFVPLCMWQGGVCHEMKPCNFREEAVNEQH